MRHEYLDAYSRPARSVIHRLPASLKLAVALATVCAIAFMPPGFATTRIGGLSWMQVEIAAALLVVAAVARIPMSFFLSRVALFLPFPMMFAVSAPLARGFDAEGMSLMTSLMVKATLSFATMLLLVNTTPFDRLLASARRWGAPTLIVATLAFMYRYLFILLDEHARIRRAQFARSFRRAGRWRLAATAIGMLVVRSYERSDRVYSAMLARGYNGQVRTLD